MVTRQLVSMLWCPTCEASGLTSFAEIANDAPFEEGELRCRECEATYPVRLGVPDLVPEAHLTSGEWALWKDHLEKFQARREERIANPGRAVTRLATRSRPQPPFAEFTGIREGTVLDVGCGPGKFRHHFDPDRVRYVGLDPIVLPEVSEFPFVRALAEYVPFRPGTFTDIVVLAALDHFRDVDRFLEEARRVLRAEGRLHILQSVHEVRGPVSAVKVMAHKVKDSLEDRSTTARGRGRDVPKHLEEFTNRSLIDRLGAAFDLVATEEYSATWYSPVKRFLTLAPKTPVATASHRFGEVGPAGPADRGDSAERSAPRA